MKKGAYRVLHHWWAPNDVASVTLLLMALAPTIHIITLVAGWSEAWRDALGLQPCKPQTYLTYALLHDRADIFHLPLNFLLLMLLGPPVERMMGKKLYATAVIGFCLLGASAAAVMTPEQWWSSGGDLVGLSAFTYGLIPTACYLGVIEVVGDPQNTKWTSWIGVAVSATACALLIYDSSQGPSGAGPVVHITGPLGGTAIASIHAFLNVRRHNKGQPPDHPRR